MASLAINTGYGSPVREHEAKHIDERVVREVSLRSAFDAVSPSVISGEARVKVDVEGVSPWKVVTATLTGVAISAVLTFLAMSLF